MSKARAERNDKSRNTAENFGQRWSEEELAQLEQLWPGSDATMDDFVALATLLGRTVEACRQAHYSLSKRRQAEVAREKIARVGTWAGGFTSLDDMGW